MIKKKNIAIITPHYFPENFIINDISKQIYKLGREVTVITGLPNYPTGRVFRGYEKIKSLNIRRQWGIDVLRFPIIPRYKASSLNLIINYISFILSGIFNVSKYLKIAKFDHIFVFGTTPITSAFLGIYIKYKLKIKLSIWVQDLWPENIEMSGHIKNKFLLKIISKIVGYIYKKCDLILVQSESFKKTLKNFTNKKIFVVENCSYNENFKNKKIPKQIAKLLKIKKTFIFAGNVGLLQSIETIIQSAEQLKNKKNICFMIIGKGSNLGQIKNLCKEKKLKNVKFFGPFDKDTVHQILKKCTGQILTLKKNKFLSMYIPQKFTMYLASRKPIIISADGETSILTKKNNLGYVGKAEDYRSLSKNILKVITLKKENLREIKKNCSNLFNKKFRLKKQTLKILEKIDNLK